MDSGSSSDMDRERADSSEFVPTVTPDRVRAVFDAVEGPVITSGDVSAELDCTTEAARRTAGRLVYWRVHDERRGGRPGGPPPGRGRG